MAEQASELNHLLEMTGCRDAADLQDMANVGKALLERMADVIEQGPLKGWMPADCPTEIVTDLANELEEARATIASQASALSKASDQLHHIMRSAEMSSGIMLDKRRTGNWPGAQKTADAFDRIGLRAAEAKAGVRAALTSWSLEKGS